MAGSAPNLPTMAPTRLITTMHDDGSSELVVECETYVSSTSRGPSAADDVRAMSSLLASTGDCAVLELRRSLPVLLRALCCAHQCPYPLDNAPLPLPSLGSLQSALVSSSSAKSSSPSPS